MQYFRLFLAVALVFGFALVLIGLPFSASKAQFPPPPGAVLDQAYINVPYEPQQTLVWCWVASARMVARYFNRQAPSQCEMLQQQYGAPCCSNPQFCWRGGYINEIQQLIGNFGLHYSAMGPPTDGYSLLALFRQGRPVVIHLRQGHFAVASGIRVMATPMGPLGVVRVLDPFYGIQDVNLPILYSQWDAGLYVY